MGLFNLLWRNRPSRQCECIVIITWMAVLLSLHIFIWHKCEDCDCSESGGRSAYLGSSGSEPKLGTRMREDRADRDGSEMRRRPALDPLRWRNDPEEFAVEYATEGLEYGVNVVPSLHKAIEGNVWHPLENYKNPCWVEKMSLEPSLTRNSPELIRAKFEQIQRQGQTFRSRRGQRQYRDTDQATGRRSKMDEHVINMTSLKAEADMRYELALYDRVQTGRPWRVRCLPFVYVIGVTKSGTSDLYRHLMLHQHVVEARTKEIHYWNVRRLPRPTYLYGKRISDGITFDNYLNYFDVAAYQINMSAVKINGSLWHPKITVDGSVSMFWEDTGWAQIPGNRRLAAPKYTTASTLAHFQPKARLILMLREPVERVYSYYRMFAAGKHKSNPETFHNETLKMLRLYDECLRFRSLRECAYDNSIEQASFSVNIRSSLYAAFMPDWLRAFPRDQIHIIRSEDYFANRKPVLDEIIKFLDLPPYSKNLLPILTDPLNKIIRHNRHHVPMFNKTRLLLQAFFQPFNDDLDRMLGQQFWIYDS